MKQDKIETIEPVAFTGGEMESDYLRWFDSRKLTFTGINGGNYLDEEDFNTYGKWASRQYEQLKAENEKLKDIIRQLIDKADLEDLEFTDQESTDELKTILKNAKLLL